MSDVQDISSPPIEENVASADDASPADLSADLERLGVIEDELTAAAAELEALDASPIADDADPDDAPAS